LEPSSQKAPIPESISLVKQNTLQHYADYNPGAEGRLRSVVTGRYPKAGSAVNPQLRKYLKTGKFLSRRVIRALQGNEDT